MPWVSILLYGLIIPAGYAGYRIAGGWGAAALALWALVAVDLVHGVFEWVAARKTGEAEAPVTKGALRDFVWFAGIGAVCWYFTGAWVALSLVGGLAVTRGLLAGILTGMEEGLEEREAERREATLGQALEVLRAHGFESDELDVSPDSSEDERHDALCAALESCMVDVCMDDCCNDGDHATILEDVSEKSGSAFEITNVSSEVDIEQDEDRPTIRVRFTHDGAERRWKFEQRGGWLDPVFLEAIAAYCAKHTSIDVAFFDASDEHARWVCCDKALAADLEELGMVKRYPAAAERVVQDGYEDLGGGGPFSDEALHAGAETLQKFFKERSMSSMARDPEKALFEMADGFISAASDAQSALDEKQSERPEKPTS